MTVDLPELAFDYRNWREDHRYVIQPEKIEYGSYDASGVHPSAPCRWVLHGWVITRDGDPRLGMGTRRRTFLFDGLRNIESATIEGVPACEFPRGGQIGVARRSKGPH